MTMTLTEQERQELLKKLLIERYGELATRPSWQIPEESNN